MADHLFTEFARANAPLRALLDQRARTARINVDLLNWNQFLAMSDEQLIEGLTEDWRRLAGPLHVATDVRPLQEPHSYERRTGDGRRLTFLRWYVVYPIRGDTEILSYWPLALDETQSGDEYGVPPPEVLWEPTGGGVLASFDVLLEDDPDRSTQPQERILNSSRYLKKVLAAANSEVAAYDAGLTADLSSAVAARRARLSAIDRQNDELVRLVREQFGPLELVDAPASSKPPPAVTPSKSAPLSLGCYVGQASFASLLRATRKWGEAVARYPGAFSKIGEEDTTSLLVATLNVAFDTAHREVFSNSGKTDIFVESTDAEGIRCAYIGECKIWRGRSRVATDLSQLLSYANEATRELLLLYFVKRIEYDKVCSGARDALSRDGRFVGWDPEGLDIATVKHVYGHSVQVALRLIHVPRESPGRTGSATER